MAENVNGSDLFGSGGHVWRWDQQRQLAKQLGTVGVIGESRMVTHAGARPVEICGRDGGPAILKATGNSRAQADTAMDALEAAIEDLRAAGTECTWEDDCARTGAHLVIVDFIRADRTYNKAGSTWTAWQRYRVRALELWGRP